MDTRREFRVTTPAEAGIAFLDGPSFGTYHDHGDDEQDAPAPQPTPKAEPARETARAPEPRPEPRPESRPEPQPRSVVVPEAPPETPEERERRIRASKTEVVEVSKGEGQPSKRGWWRRGG